MNTKRKKHKGHPRRTERGVRSSTRKTVPEEGIHRLGLGSRIAARFAGLGFNEDIPEQRGQPAQPADFGPDED